MSYRCPMCGTSGRIWKKKPNVFVCPNCFSLYSEYGFVLESQKEVPEYWN